MYNRYIPQSDGSYRRRTMQDPACHGHQPSSPRPQPVPPPNPPGEPECPPPASPPKSKPQPPRQNGSAVSFLKNLIPNDFDTGDLMIILLLILMAGDCQDDQNWVWLTLALYLFL